MTDDYPAYSNEYQETKSTLILNEFRRTNASHLSCYQTRKDQAPRNPKPSVIRQSCS